MYEIAVEQHFDAAHALRGYKGKCESLHGHRFVVVARAKATKLNDIGIVYDFTDLKRHLGDILSRFDHINLNETAPFDRMNPSSENIASTVYHALEEKLAGEPVSLVSVEVHESPENRVSYSPG